MRKSSPYKIGMRLFTLSITLLLLTILTACENAENKTAASSDKENESKQTINKANCHPNGNTISGSCY